MASCRPLLGEKGHHSTDVVAARGYSLARTQIQTIVLVRVRAELDNLKLRLICMHVYTCIYVLYMHMACIHMNICVIYI
jgi:hypothetical protein